MAIDKLTAGVNAKDPAASTGSDVATAVNALIDVHVPNLKALGSITPVEGVTYQVQEMSINTGFGGGPKYWDAAAQHNGVTAFAPAAIAAWDGTKEDINTLINYVGAPAGAWVRVLLAGPAKPLLSAEMAGAVYGLDNTIPINKAFEVARLVGGAEVYYHGSELIISAPIDIRFAHGCSLRSDGACTIRNVNPSTNKRESAIFKTGSLYQQDVTDLDYKALSGQVYEGQTVVTLSTPGDASIFSVGTPVFFHGGVYADSGSFRFYENGIFTRVKSISGANIELEHPIPRNSSVNNAIALWDSTINSTVTAEPLSYVHHFRLVGQWSAYSEARGYLFTGDGSMDCDYDFDTVNCDAYVFCNAWTNTKIHCKSAYVDRTFYELAVNSAYNKVTLDFGKILTAGAAGKRMIRTSENGSHNLFDFGFIDADLFTASDVPIYIDAAYKTKIKGRRFSARNAPLRLATIQNQATSPSVLSCIENTLELDLLVGGASQRYADMVSNGTSDLNTIIIRKAIGAISGTSAVQLAGSNPTLKDSSFEYGDLSLAAGTTNETVVNTFVPDGIADASRPLSLGSYSMKSNGINAIRANNKRVGQSVVSGTALVVIDSVTYPAKSLRQNHQIRIEAGFQVGGAGGDKTMILSVGGTDIATVVLSAPETGQVTICGALQILSTTGVTYNFQVVSATDTYGLTSGITVPNLLMNSLTVELKAQKAVEGDSINRRSYVIDAVIPESGIR